MIEGWVDTLLKHRDLLGLLRYDAALFSRQPLYHRMFLVSDQAVAIIAGPSASQRERVRAVQALAMANDPVIFFLQADRDRLRADMLDGIRRLLDSGTEAPAEPASALRRGRPVALSAEQVRAARARYESGSTVAQIAAQLGVSRATLYRHLQRSDF